MRGPKNSVSSWLFLPFNKRPSDVLDHLRYWSSMALPGVLTAFHRDHVLVSRGMTLTVAVRARAPCGHCGFSFKLGMARDGHGGMVPFLRFFIQQILRSGISCTGCFTACANSGFQIVDRLCWPPPTFVLRGGLRSDDRRSAVYLPSQSRVSLTQRVHFAGY